MSEKISEHEITIRTKVHDFYCDECGKLIYSYNDSQMLEDSSNISRPNNLICNINVASTWYTYNKLLCTDCKIKKVKELNDSVGPVLLKLGFVQDR